MSHDDELKIDIESQIQGQQKLRLSAPKSEKPKPYILKDYPKKVLVIDDFIDNDTCQTLYQYLIYKLDHDKSFSHTNCNEQFSNVLVPSYGIDNSDIKSIVLDIIDRKHQLIKQQFVDPLVKQNPQLYEGIALHHDSSDLVRWSPESNPSLGEHADNQYWDMPNKLHYSAHRDWSSVLYLNNDFEGGEFYFKEPHIKIEPKPGRLVIFGSGIDYIHGVKSVTKGARYTLPSWWTYGNRPETPMKCRS